MTSFLETYFSNIHSVLIFLTKRGEENVIDIEREREKKEKVRERERERERERQNDDTKANTVIKVFKVLNFHQICRNDLF